MAIFDDIQERLREVEYAQQIKIIYACESGSRAWGFPSADSDYDVRFLYVHPVDWYLSIEEKRDVIEYPISSDLDITGWDLRKALQLFRKSNTPLLEWLGSPIVYRERYQVAGKLRELAKTAYSPVTCIYRYLHMAQDNYQRFLQGEQVWLKKYFYVLRPILAINWIEQGYGLAPTPIGKLIERVITSPPLKAAIQNLIKLKLERNEIDFGPRIELISDYIDAEMTRLKNYRAEYHGDAVSYECLDEIFRNGLEEAWHSMEGSYDTVSD